MFMAAFYCGFFANHIDIASNYSGTLLALTNTAATIPGFIVPVFVGELTHGNVINLHNDVKNIILKSIFLSKPTAKLGAVADHFLHNGCYFMYRVHRLHSDGLGRGAILEQDLCEQRCQHFSGRGEIERQTKTQCVTLMRSIHNINIQFYYIYIFCLFLFSVCCNKVWVEWDYVGKSRVYPLFQLI